MTHDTVTNFAASLVEMAKATERVPILEAALNAANRDISTHLDRIAVLETKCISYRTTIDTLHSDIHTLEVARDDAELRFLEAAERTEKALAALRTVFGSTGSVIQALDPPKAADEPHPFGDHGGGMAQPTTYTPSMPQPTEDEIEHALAEVTEVQPDPSTAPASPPPATTHAADTSGSASIGIEGEGVSVLPDPTATTVELPETASSSSADKVSDVEHMAQTPLSEGERADPFSESTLHQPASTTPPNLVSSATDTASASPPDDVGYHNEPGKGQGSAWWDWANRMDMKYGQYRWPLRS